MPPTHITCYFISKCTCLCQYTFITIRCFCNYITVFWALVGSCGHDNARKLLTGFVFMKKRVYSIALSARRIRVLGMGWLGALSANP